MQIHMLPGEKKVFVPLKTVAKGIEIQWRDGGR
jgi:hypothetical protein